MGKRLDIDAVCVTPDFSILMAVERLDQVASQILLVVDDQRRILGSITDGDIRRGLLRKISMDALVAEVMNTHPITADSNISREDALRLLLQKELRHLPLLNKQGSVVDVLALEELTAVEPVTYPVVIMAGGLGMRLRPLTEKVPKPMISLGGKPLLETLVQRLARHGFSDITLTVNYMADVIRDHFGDGSRFGVSIRYVEETERMGTAGALRLLPRRPSDPMLVLNGDVLTNVDFRRLLDFHKEALAEATMCVRGYDVEVPFGVVQLDGSDIHSIVEKPVHQFFINAGIYVLDPSVLDLMSANEAMVDMPTLFQRVKARGGKAVAFPMREYWIDIGRHNDLVQAEQDFPDVF